MRENFLGPRSHAAERLYRDGAVMLWPLHVALLQGLLDRPGGVAGSRIDLVRAAVPHAERLRGSTPSWGMVYKAVPAVIGRGWIAGSAPATAPQRRQL